MQPITTISDRSRATPRIEGLSDDDLSRIAYASVEEMVFLEMNDGNRLAYHIYLYLKGEIPSIEVAIYEAKSRIDIDPKQLEHIIEHRLSAAGAIIE